ncbi:hypothetical protein GCM10028819_50020 [Spirosoma humi]
MLGYSQKGVSSIKPVHWIAIVVVVGGVATLFKEIGSSENTKSIKETGEKTHNEVLGLKHQNEELKIQNDDLQSKINKQEKVIDKFRQENNELASKLSQQVLRAYNYTTGGDEPRKNYPFIKIWEKSYEKEIVAYLEGGEKYPIYDIRVRITYLPQVLEVESIDANGVKKMTSGFPIEYNFRENEIAQNREITLGWFKVPHVEKYALLIEISSRTGTWIQDYEVTNSHDKTKPLVENHHIISKIYEGTLENSQKRILIGEYDSIKDGRAIHFKKKPDITKD